MGEAVLKEKMGTQLAADLSWLFDATGAPGWHDWLGLLIAGFGFSIAILQIRDAKSASENAARESAKATLALTAAQKNLSQRALMAVLPQIQTVVTDLAYAFPTNDVEVAQRTLVRFGLIARETCGLLEGLHGDHTELSRRLLKASEKATRAKSTIVSSANPDVISAAKSVSADIDKLSQDLAGLVSSMRHTIEGASIV